MLKPPYKRSTVKLIAQQNFNPGGTKKKWNHWNEKIQEHFESFRTYYENIFIPDHYKYNFLKNNDIW